MASKGRNMWLSSIAIKYILIDIVVFDYVLFPKEVVLHLLTYQRLTSTKQYTEGS